MIAVVTWLWQEGFRDYSAEHVNVLARMIKRRLSLPHRFICITDSHEGLDNGVTWFPTPEAVTSLRRMQSPEGGRFPSCYRRLWMWSDAARELGDRVMLIDIDLTAHAELTPLFDRRADFVGWRPRAQWGQPTRYGGGLYLLTPGTRTHVWTSFDGNKSVRTARANGFRGSDQAWISFALGHAEDVWPDDAGLYSIRDIQNGKLPLPRDARLVQFNGPQKPWNTQLAWAREAWR